MLCAWMMFLGKDLERIVSVGLEQHVMEQVMMKTALVCAHFPALLREYASVMLSAVKNQIFIILAVLR